MCAEQKLYLVYQNQRIMILNVPIHSSMVTVLILFANSHCSNLYSL